MPSNTYTVDHPLSYTLEIKFTRPRGRSEPLAEYPLHQAEQQVLKRKDFKINLLVSVSNGRGSDLCSSQRPLTVSS